ncbi:CopG family antitoxin [Verminephrobacter aporrectodeae]|uniref:CopG family antitoxin n=1 Tax=Verminephrobacter aporrectodeae TaxID=1110389 RepID=UPI000237540F|nr:CopG family antitoxin [Verminephrobacter aporrectodeae]MCW5219849.1 hypothetical protein [Verminephrobacter aporrectodeae subsp. tuberculatae]MCW5256154.1 hypothetical protein [Verminephrobacter aporrectodeae subsp. tuberculatae]MCW5289137.1 hypothetical protein [Verminephrobacter aporrectodeae subsp. tuberculatae]MCW8166214.1 hypothetical protein [Verminephrobacter aporrectodeae subsp. tuberculatae]MCW8170198.1 hypothetical protein [Verminephrobacter aporrectodeae subsp. tuberculatae]
MKAKSESESRKPSSVPALGSDAHTERFVAAAKLFGPDLTEGFRPTYFEFEAKSATLNMRLPKELLGALKAKAQAQGIPYTRYVRQVLEYVVTR